MATSRRHFLQLLAGGAAWVTLPLGARLRPSDITWYDVRDWGVEGRGWSDTKRYFDRLPGKAEGVVREPVWELSRHSAGMTVRFVTWLEIHYH